MAIDKKGKLYLKGVACEPIIFEADDNSMIEPEGGSDGQVIKKDDGSTVWANESVKDVTINGTSVVDASGVAIVPESDSVVANPVLAGDEDSLSGIEVNGTKYKVDAGGGTEVIANPTLAGTEADLTGLQVGETKYKVPSGGSEYDVVLTNQTDEHSPEYAAFVHIFSEIETNYKAGTEPERFEKRVKIQDVWGLTLSSICLDFGGISYDAFCYAFLGRDLANSSIRTGYYVYADVMERDTDDSAYNRATFAKHEYYAGLNDPYDTMSCAYMSFNTETYYYNGVMVIGYDPDLKEEEIEE